MVSLKTGQLQRKNLSTSSSTKRFFGNISFVVVLNLLVKPGWVVVEGLVQDRLGHAVFGTVTALTSLTMILAVLSDLGLTHFSVQRLAAEPGFVAESFPVLLPLRGGLNIVALGMMLLVGLGLGYHGEQLVVLGAVGISLLLTQFTQFIRGTLQASQRFNTDAVLSVLEKVLLLLFVLVCLPGGLTLTRYLGVRLMAAGFTTALLYGLMVYLFGRVRYDFNFSKARNLLRQSMPFALITLLYGINERIDMVMLERLASPAEAGYYAAAYRWVDASMMYVWTVLPLFFAKFASLQHNRAEQQSLLWFGQRVVAVPMILVVGFVWFNGDKLFWNLVHSRPAEVARMVFCVKVLFVNVLVHSFFAIYASLLNSAGHVRLVSRLVMASIVLNVVLNVLTLSSFGAVGAAWNTLASAVLVSVGYVVLMPRTEVTVPWLLLGRLLGITVVLCTVWYQLREHANFSWLIETAVMVPIFAVLLLMFGLVRLSELRRFSG